jgi:hypothetical protein
MMPNTDLSAVRALSAADRDLVANALADSVHLVDDDMGDDPKQRHAAYKSLAQLVRDLVA